MISWPQLIKCRFKLLAGGQVVLHLRSVSDLDGQLHVRRQEGGSQRYQI